MKFALPRKGAFETQIVLKGQGSFSVELNGRYGDNSFLFRFPLSKYHYV